MYGVMVGDNDLPKKRRKVKKKKLRLLLLGCMSIFIIGLTTFTIGKSWVEIYDKYKEKKQLDKELVDLREKEDELRADADRLKDPDYIARYAREKYLYSKDGEFIIKIPTHLIEIITISATKTINMSSINLTFIPLLFASEEFILIAKSLLKKKYQKHNTITAIPSSRKISSGTMLKISPIK